MEIITSLENSSVKQAKSLQDKKFRRNFGQFLVEGKKQVKEALSKGIEVDKLFIEERKISEFENIIASTFAPVLFCTDKVMKSISDTVTSQGIIAVCTLPPIGLYKFKNTDKILILDQIRDPGNMGTIIRTASAVGFNIIFTIDSVDVFSPKVIRSTSCGIFNVQIYPTDYSEIIALCKKNQISLLVADMAGKNIFDNFEKPPSYAIVVGNEGNGVNIQLKEIGTKVRIPMNSNTESLNAAISASVLMYMLEGSNIN